MEEKVHPPEASRHVFISYARADAQYAERLDRDLRARGFATWRDTRNLDPSQDFTGEIEWAIRRASHVVVCLTPNIEQRRDSFVRREVAYALGRDRKRRKEDPPRRLPVIPMMFSGGELPLQISTWTKIEIRGDQKSYQEGLDALLIRLQRRDEPAEPITYQDPALVDYLNALHEWTSQRLQEGVHTLLTLAAADTPEAVDRQAVPSLSFHFDVSPVLVDRTPSTAQNPVREATGHLAFSSFVEAYEHHKGRLLLLGAPGAGKTTTLLAFARDSAVARLNAPALPVPILASIHRWDQKTPIPEWVCRDIRSIDLSDYHVLYLLDGLDELGGVRPVDPEKPDGEQYDPRAAFIKALQTQVPDDPLVVTSRIADYDAIGHKVALPGAATLKPLTEVQIEVYLRARRQSALWEALRADKGSGTAVEQKISVSLLSKRVTLKTAEKRRF